MKLSYRSTRGPDYRSIVTWVIRIATPVLLTLYPVVLTELDAKIFDFVLMTRLTKVSTGSYVSCLSYIPTDAARRCSSYHIYRK